MERFCLDCSNVNIFLVILCYSFISDYIPWGNYVKDTMNSSIIIDYNASQIYNYVLKFLIKIYLDVNLRTKFDFGD